MKDVQRRKRMMVEGLHQMHDARTVASGVELIMGEGRFVAPRTLEIALNDGGSRRIFGERVFLVLGSRATMPKVPGLAAANPMTHIDALDLDRLPASLIVMGGGYVGLELAQPMRRFGSQVTVIERGPQLASREDPDVGAALLELLHDEGIDVLLGTEIRRVEGRSAESIRIHAKDGQGERIVEGTDLLVAAGRTPNTDGIGLEEAGVELTGHGYISVNERLETTAANVWAMGDCAGSPQFTHAAYNDFRVVRDNLNGGNRTTKDRLVPFCMFTDPELARVGRNESEARRGRISSGQDADGGCAAHEDGVRTARVPEDADRRAERRDPGIHRVWCRGERTDGRRPNRDGRADALYDAARCDFHSPDRVGGAGLFARSSRTP